MNTFWKIFATGFGAGYSPIAPGTMGALVGMLIILPKMLWGFACFHPVSFVDIDLLVLIVVFFAIGVLATNALEKEWGHDPQKIVIDEIVGYWIALLVVPFSWNTLILAFILFRIFDIWKPLGIRKMEKLKGGWGVMMDDVLAGVYANIVLQVLLYAFPELL